MTSDDKEKMYNRCQFYFESKAALASPKTSALPVYMNGLNNEYFKPTNDINVVEAMKSYAEFRRPSEYTMELCGRLRGLSEHLSGMCVGLKMGGRSVLATDVARRFEGYVRSVDNDPVKTSPDHVPDPLCLRNYKQFKEDTNGQVLKTYEPTNGDPDKFDKLLERCKANTLKKLKEIAAGDITSYLQNVEKCKTRLNLVNKKPSSETIHKSLDTAKKLLEAMETLILDKIQTFMNGHGSMDGLEALVAQIKTEDVLDKVKELLKRAGLAIDAACKKQANANAKKENLPESTPRVETTAAAAAPPKTAAPAAAAPPKTAASAASTPLLDRIKKEPWIAIIGVVVLLLILALMAFFACTSPGPGSAKAKWAYDVENPAPRGSADGSLPAP